MLSISHAVRAALLVLSLPVALRAQGEPKRPPVAPEADPNDWESYFDRGEKLFKLESGMAPAYFYWASRLDPSRAEPYFARWASVMFFSRNEEIHGWLRRERSVITRPKFVTADSLRALALARNPFVHRGFEAMVYGRLPGNLSDSPDPRAWAAYSAGRFATAVELYGRKIEQGGSRALNARLDRAIAAVAANDLPLAASDLRTLVGELRKLDESRLNDYYFSKHQLLYMLALVHGQMGNPRAARDAMGEAVVEDASFAYGHAGVGMLARAARQDDAAAAAYATAIELAPTDGQLRYVHAQVLFDLQRFEGAATELDQAIKLEPYWAAPHLLYGRVRERQGREAEAYPHYEQYVRMAPLKDPAAQGMKLRLERRAKADTTRKTP